jgi:hypothetical protein
VIFLNLEFHVRNPGSILLQEISLIIIMEWHGIKIVLPVQINIKADMFQAFSDVNTEKRFLKKV